jgi:nucleoside-diphosphate-sugar epimerase
MRRIGIEPTTELPEFTTEDHVLVCVAGSVALAKVCAALRGVPARAVLTSSTGYYDGRTGTITADTTHGPSERARNAEAAEHAFHAWNPAGIVLRLGGLYRPGRGPVPALLRRGTVPPGPPDRAMALVHYDDAARAVGAALVHPDPRSTYLVVTPPCPARREFYEAAAARYHLPAPTFTEPVGTVSYAVDGTRADLLATPQWPDWRAALE